MSQTDEGQGSKNSGDRGSSARGWDRDRVTVRLSADRAKALRGLVADAPDATPTDAIDLAIELAREASRSPQIEAADVGAAGSDGMELRLTALLASQFDELASAVSDLRAKLDELRMAFVAALESAETPGALAQPSRQADAGISAAPVGLTAWLASASLAAGLSLGASAVVKGRIVEAQAAGANDLVLDLSAELVAVDGIHAVSRDGDARPLVRLGPVPADVALAAGIEICLWCQRDNAGWQVKVHAVDERGRIGKLVATHRA